MIIGIIFGIVAIAIGAWRQTNMLIEDVTGPLATARYWQNTTTRGLSLLAVIVFSMIAAFSLARQIEPYVGKGIAAFSFGVFLYLRYAISTMTMSVTSKETLTTHIEAQKNSANMILPTKQSESKDATWSRSAKTSKTGTPATHANIYKTNKTGFSKMKLPAKAALVLKYDEQARCLWESIGHLPIPLQEKFLLALTDSNKQDLEALVEKLNQEHEKPFESENANSCLNIARGLSDDAGAEFEEVYRSIGHITSPQDILNTIRKNTKSIYSSRSAPEVSQRRKNEQAILNTIGFGFFVLCIAIAGIAILSTG